MKQLHKQYSVNNRRDDELQIPTHASSFPAKNQRPKSWPKSLINYLLKEQRLIFVLVGMLIASMFFMLQPSLFKLGTGENRNAVYPPAVLRDNLQEIGQYRYADVGLGAKNRRLPVGLREKTRRIVVTGGAGFVGSHLVDKLLDRGDCVIVVDNFFTGRKENVLHHLGNPRFELIRHDVVEPILLEVDQIYHLACPASPVHYNMCFIHYPVTKSLAYTDPYYPRHYVGHTGGGEESLKTLNLVGSIPRILISRFCYQHGTNVMGTLNMLGLAKRIGARFLLTSTSEVYGDPLEHPQKESYWGNVNPIGVRSCYDEGKRTAETLAMDYHRGANLEVRIARIFNTYGPRMCIDDGRVVSNFVAQALRGEPMTVYGDGKQTRSFQYVSDLVDGLVRLMEGEHVGPFNLGNPGEFTMLELAEVVKETVDPSATVVFKPNTADDPHKRKPDITRAKELLNWEPKISLKEGLPMMVADFRKRVNE